MGILRDILDASRDISNFGSLEEVFRRRKYSSLSKRSLEGTMQFPVLVSKSLDIDTLQTISKALERQYSSFVQIALTMSPQLSVENDRDAIGYLKRFHQNTNVRTDLKDVFNAGMDIMESYVPYSNGMKNVFLFAAVYEGSTSTLVAANKEQLTSIMEHIRRDVLNDKFVPKKDTYVMKVVKEDVGDISGSRATVLGSGNNAGDNANIASTFMQDNSGQTNTHRGDLNLNGGTNIDTVNVTVRGGDNGPRIPGVPANRARSAKDMDVNIVSNNILRDNDVKKANELVPTTLHIRTIMMNAENEQQGYLDFIIGIKSTMHPINSDEMVNNIVSGVKNQNKFFNFVKWTSGETNFFKDFLFGIREIKDDVVDRSSGASPWWITLKRRRTLAKLKDSMFLPNGILPNTSIVISAEEAEMIKSTQGFDLLDPNVAERLMKQYFLLGFVVVDNSTQIAHFYFDGQSAYQSTTFQALERENSSKSDMKELMKIVNRSKMI